MNDPTHPVAATAPAYADDAYGWAYAQAALIRARRFAEVDWENVVEEIESVGKSEQSAAESALRVLMMHILKWQMQPERRGRSWALTIVEQRLRYAQRMRQNPGLRPLVEEMRANAYRLARVAAAREMDVPLEDVAPEPPAWPMILDEPFEPQS